MLSKDNLSSRKALGDWGHGKSNYRDNAKQSVMSVCHRYWAQIDRFAIQELSWSIYMPLHHFTWSLIHASTTTATSSCQLNFALSCCNFSIETILVFWLSWLFIFYAMTTEKRTARSAQLLAQTTLDKKWTGKTEDGNVSCTMSYTFIIMYQKYIIYF